MATYSPLPDCKGRQGREGGGERGRAGCNKKGRKVGDICLDPYKWGGLFWSNPYENRA